jgi:general secretion pathway protein D
VIAENDRMIVLGGLTQDDISQNRQKVPFLGDIPILGQLFTYRSNLRNKTNLLVFLRPRIIRATGDMDGPTRRKYDYLEEMTVDQKIRKSGDTSPLILKWDNFEPAEEDAEQQAGSENKK